MTDAGPLDAASFFAALERRRTQALVQRDMALIEALHAPGYELITPAGRVFTREEYLGAIAREPFYSGWDCGDEMRCRVTADMALVRYRATLRFPSGRELACWHTDAYERDGATGRLWAVWSQATEVRKAVPAG